MKSWLRELCPEIDAWQVDMIAQHMEEAINAEREACIAAIENVAFGYAAPVWAFDLVKAIRARQSL